MLEIIVIALLVNIAASLIFVLAQPVVERLRNTRPLLVVAMALFVLLASAGLYKVAHWQPESSVGLPIVILQTIGFTQSINNQIGEAFSKINSLSRVLRAALSISFVLSGTLTLTIYLRWLHRPGISHISEYGIPVEERDYRTPAYCLTLAILFRFGVIPLVLNTIGKYENNVATSIVIASAIGLLISNERLRFMISNERLGFATSFVFRVATLAIVSICAIVLWRALGAKEFLVINGRVLLCSFGPLSLNYLVWERIPTFLAVVAIVLDGFIPFVVP